MLTVPGVEAGLQLVAAGQQLGRARGELLVQPGQRRPEPLRREPHPRQQLVGHEGAQGGVHLQAAGLGSVAGLGCVAHLDPPSSSGPSSAVARFLPPHPDESRVCAADGPALHQPAQVGEHPGAGGTDAPDRDADVVGDPRVRAAVVGEQGRQQLPPPRRERREGAVTAARSSARSISSTTSCSGPGPASTGPTSAITTVRAAVLQHPQALAVRHRGEPAGQVLGRVDPVEVLGQAQPGHLDHVVRVGVLQAVAADAAAQHGRVAGDDRGPGVGVAGGGAAQQVGGGRVARLGRGRRGRQGRESAGSGWASRSPGLRRVVHPTLVTGPSRATDAGPGSLGRFARALGTVSRSVDRRAVSPNGVRDQPPRTPATTREPSIREWPGDIGLSCGTVSPAATVLVVDDHPVVRRGLAAMLGLEDWVGRVVEAGSVREGAAVGATERADVAVVDLGLPDGDGVELVRRLRRAPGCPVLVLTMTRDEGVVRACLAAGAGGYLLKDSPPDAVVRAARTVLDGGLVLGPEVARAALPTGRPARLPAPLDRLSPGGPAPARPPRGRPDEPAHRRRAGRRGEDRAQPGVGPARRAGCRGPGAGRPAGPGEGPADRRSLFRMTGTRATLAATGAARVKGCAMTNDQDVVLMIKDDGLLHVGTRGAVLDHLLENPQGPAPDDRPVRPGRAAAEGRRAARRHLRDRARRRPTGRPRRAAVARPHRPGAGALAGAARHATRPSRRTARRRRSGCCG